MRNGTERIEIKRWKGEVDKWMVRLKRTERRMQVTCIIR